MNIGSLILKIFERLGISGWSKSKKMVYGIGALMSLFLILVATSNHKTSQKPTLAKVTLVPRELEPQKQLSYEFIKFDTISIPTFPPAEKPLIEALPLAESSDQTTQDAIKLKESIRSKIAQVKSALPERPSRTSFTSSRRNPNMIVMNNMAENPVTSAAAPMTTFSGNQSVLLKVVLPEPTPVSTGSLVEARVIKDSQWGNLAIPRRSKVIGVASLFNRRVQIDFREIVINDVSRSCSGRAYDLKRLQGVPYSPVSSEAKRVLIDEMRDAVAGVPIVGRVANRQTLSTNYQQDISELDEGLEFYVLINSIF